MVQVLLLQTLHGASDVPEADDVTPVRQLLLGDPLEFGHVSLILAKLREDLESVEHERHRRLLLVFEIHLLRLGKVEHRLGRVCFMLTNCVPQHSSSDTVHERSNHLRDVAGRLRLDVSVSNANAVDDDEGTDGGEETGTRSGFRVGRFEMAKEGPDARLEVPHQAVASRGWVLQRVNESLEPLNLARTQRRVLKRALPMGGRIDVETEAVQNEAVKDEGVFFDAGTAEPVELVLGRFVHTTEKGGEKPRCMQ